MVRRLALAEGSPFPRCCGAERPGERRRIHRAVHFQRKGTSVGGPHQQVSVVLSMLAFFGKTIFVTFLQVFFRWTLPRFRYDQIMNLGWKILLPVSIANFVITAIVVLAF